MRLLLALLVVLGAAPAPLDFYQTSHWTGGDGAYSVPLGPDRLLWMFGDTFTDRIVDGRRASLAMIHNSFAITSGGSTRFFPVALAPDDPGAYYWPSDGAMWNGRLWLFEKIVRDLPDGPPGLSFEWLGDELVEVENPHEDPPAWRIARHAAGPLHPGIACLVHEGLLYAYGLRESEVVLVRYDACLRPEYYAGGRWLADPSQASPLWGQGAAEMSVFPWRDGFLAVYTEGGLGARIVARVAPAPEGPWGEPVELYRAPTEPGLLVYAGKAHRTLSGPDRLTVSYCRNVGALESHRDRPEVYFPRFVEVKVAGEKNGP